MGRTRSIDRAAVMLAIETVVRRDGVAALSIDAVARQAGIAKSSVVYDFGSKDALLAAFVQDRLARKQAEIDVAQQAHAGQDSAWLRGMLDTVRNAPTDEDRSVAMTVAAGMRAAEARRCMAQTVSEDLRTVAAQAGCGRAARLAYLSLFGLMSAEYFGCHRFDPAERGAVLDDIACLISLSLAPAIA